VKDRQKAKKDKLSGKKKHNIPITVRQLEAIIRISESLAKMALNQNVEEEHVHEAHRLFTVTSAVLHHHYNTFIGFNSKRPVRRSKNWYNCSTRNQKHSLKN